MAGSAAPFGNISTGAEITDRIQPTQYIPDNYDYER